MVYQLLQQTGQDIAIFYINLQKQKKQKTKKLTAHFARVEYDLQPIDPSAVWEGVLQADSMWAIPKARIVQNEASRGL